MLLKVIWLYFYPYEYFISFLEYTKYGNQPSNDYGDYGDYNPKQAAPSSSGPLGSLLTVNGILSSILVLVGLTLFSQTFAKVWPLIGNQDKKPTERAMRMFKEIEDSAVANFMTSIDEFKTKYLN